MFTLCLRLRLLLPLCLLHRCEPGLTPAEQNYSQLEPECLAIVHECEKFRVYILGAHFEIITDHKPFVNLFDNAQSRMPLRIERWSLRLKEFDFTIIQFKGVANPANLLSRHKEGN